MTLLRDPIRTIENVYYSIVGLSFILFSLLRYSLKANLFFAFQILFIDHIQRGKIIYKVRIHVYNTKLSYLSVWVTGSFLGQIKISSVFFYIRLNIIMSLRLARISKK